MKKKKVVQVLNALICDFLQAKGYEQYQKGNEIGWINRQSKGDLYFFDLGLIPAGGLNSGIFKLEPSLTVSIKEVEDIYRLVTTNKYLNNEISFRTFAFNLSSLDAFPDGIIRGIGHPRYNWIIDREENISSVEKKLRTSLEEIAFPWIEENASVPKVDELFNENLKSYIIYSPSNPDRAMRGIIAGKLVGRSNLKEVIFLYDNLLRKCAENIQREYNALKTLLPKIEQKYFI